MTFGSTFGRTFSPTFQPKSQAVAGGGWWDLAPNCVAAYQPKGAADYADSLVNLANPGLYNADDEGTHAPDWDSAGWTQNSGAYLLTGLTISAASNWSIIMRHDNFNNTLWDYYGMFGVVSYQHEYSIYGRNNDPGYYIGNANYQQSNRWANGTNYLCLTPTYAFINGTASAHSITYTGFSGELNIGRSHALSNIRYFPFTISAFAVYNADLTPTQISDLATAMAAL